MITTNWHTHTKRCGHAVGEDEEYVQAAIKAGVKTLGFSDHAPYIKPCPGERMDFEQYEDYKASILALKNKYKDEIDIHLGMEVEYYPSEWNEIKRYREELEYVILGQHNLYLDEGSSYNFTTSEELNSYTDKLAEACQHALGDYIAHPDVCLWQYPRIDGSVKEIAERIAKISIQYNIPLELNCGSGVRDYGYHNYEEGYRYAYPTRAFFEVFEKYQCPIIIGMDIHDPSHFLTDEYLNRALNIVEGMHLNFLTDYDLVSAAKERKKLFY